MCFLLADISASGHVGARTGWWCHPEPPHEDTLGRSTAIDKGQQRLQEGDQGLQKKQEL